MSKERGITTTTVIVYVIAVIIAIGTLATISTYSYRQINKTLAKNSDAKSYTTFMSFFIQDIQTKNNSVNGTSEQVQKEDGTEYTSSQINFANGNEYVYSAKDKIIYRNYVKVCEGVDYCKFYTQQVSNGMTMVKIDFKIGDFQKMGQDALTFYM